jgi:uncharacterized membrane protein
MQRLRSGPLVAAGTLLGIGMGGFLDGIVFHQILQWHQMLSSWIPPVDLVSAKVNMVWDGLFHAVTWTTTMLGILLLWRATKRDDVPRSSRVLGGAMALGWGSFNGVEGLVDHQVLGVHHVHPGDGQLTWDLLFIASGVLLVTIGVLLVREGRRRVAGA